MPEVSPLRVVHPGCSVAMVVVVAAAARVGVIRCAVVGTEAHAVTPNAYATVAMRARARWMVRARSGIDTSAAKHAWSSGRCHPVSPVPVKVPRRRRSAGMDAHLARTRGAEMVVRRADRRVSRGSAPNRGVTPAGHPGQPPVPRIPVIRHPRRQYAAAGSRWQPEVASAGSFVPGIRSRSTVDERRPGHAEQHNAAEHGHQGPRPGRPRGCS